jgi:hypothetical protein
MLGVPLGNDGFVADFVGNFLVVCNNQLVDFEDTQSAFYLLRVSFSIVRSVHFMRTPVGGSGCEVRHDGS